MQEEKRPDRPSPCPECGGPRVAVFCTPGMNLVPSFASSAPLSYLRAVSCADCGHTTLYAYARGLEKLRGLLPGQGEGRER